MPVVTSVTTITQFDSEPSGGFLRSDIFGGTGDADVLISNFSLDSNVTQQHLPDVSQPAASSIAGGHPTRVPEGDYWADSPKNRPIDILYRHRYGWGRDKEELYPQPGLNTLASGASGQRWGKLDDNSGVIAYEREWPSVSEATIWQMGSFLENGPGAEDNTYYMSWAGSVLQFSIDPLLESSADLKQLPEVTGETTLKVSNFLLDASPRPHSIKNPIDTDIFIRLGNFVDPFDEDSFVLYIDEVEQPTLLVEGFTGGNGGFNVTWTNTTQFRYDARVNVRWEFRDTSIPSNLYGISYPFYTVQDLAGPRISGLVPPHDATDIPIRTTLQFEVEDFENGIDISTLVMYVNNVKVVDGETGTLQTIQYQNLKGYTVRYTHNEPWLYGDLIPVAIFIQDTSKNDNETFFSYSFTTEGSIAPALINLKPLECTVAVPVGTHVRLDIIDGGHGLDKDSIVLSVDGVERGDQVILIPILHRED